MHKSTVTKLVQWLEGHLTVRLKAASMSATASHPEHRGVTPVSVVVTDRDADGRTVGSHEEVVKRNTWYAVNVEQLRAVSDRKRSVEPDLAG